MDIIVTTPKGQMANAAREAADCIAAGGGDYFRRFSPEAGPIIRPGDRVYYVEDGYVRGFAIVARIEDRPWLRCDTTGVHWPSGLYAFMHAASWHWIHPIPMTGFQGFRYAVHWLDDGRSVSGIMQGFPRIKIVGGWLDPKPRIAAETQRAQR